MLRDVQCIDLKGSRWTKEWNCENQAKGKVTTRGNARSESDQYSFSKQAEGGAAERRADSVRSVSFSDRVCGKDFLPINTDSGTSCINAHAPDFFISSFL